MKVNFQGEQYQLVITDHARARMRTRGLKPNDLIEVLEKGKVKKKDKLEKYWIYKKLPSRADNYICLSVSVEDPFLIVITTLVNWRPL